jgi:RND family efflux transporter MFP subunit
MLPAATAAAGLLGAFYCGIWLGQGTQDDQKPASTARQTADPSRRTDPAQAHAPGGEPVVPVRTAPIRLQRIAETIAAYGRVVAQPGQTRVSSLPFQATVERVLVTAGQELTSGTPLVEMKPSSASRTELLQAQQSLESSSQQLHEVRDEYRQHLAVNTQLVQAEQAYRSARLSLERLQKEGVGQRTTISAPSAGIVSRIDVQEGQLVAAGAPIIEMAVANRIEVKLGLEPEDIPRVHAGDPVELTPVHLDPGRAITGHVRLVTREADPTTALIAVFVSLPPDAELTLSGYVRGTLTIQAAQALVVPTEAVLPEKDGYTLYTVHDGRAIRHLVHIGLETDTTVQVEGTGVSAGEEAIVAGNYELTPGMAVSAQAPR